MVNRDMQWYKIAASVWVIMGLLSLSACSKQESSNETTILEFTKNGEVSSSIVENFDKEYYNKDELQQDILKEVSDYNKISSTGGISVNKIEVKDNQAVVQMTYASPTDYAAFNEVIFFDGTIKEAEESGLDLNVVLSNVKDTQDTVGKSDIIAMEGYRIIIMDVPETIVLKGKAVYAGDNVEVGKNLKSVGRLKDTEGMAYIIYK